MSYTSLSFIVFLLFVFVIYFLVPKKNRWVILLISSCIFYGFASKFLSFVMVGTTAVTYGGGRLIGNQTERYKEAKQGLEKQERKLLKAKTDKKKRLILAVCVIADLLVLFVMKYSPFFIDTFNSIAGTAFSEIKFVLPLGISYYTLTSISYVSDIYKGIIAAEKNPLKVLLFVSFFPHIVEGPFSRYNELSPSLFEGAKFDYERFIKGFLRILYGFAKKMIFADRAGIYVNDVFGSYMSQSGSTALLAVVMYTFQIYAEFSGCMDIVCGISDVLGISLSENFRQPFFSKSIDEFWRRWHITLGAWLKDYIFFPIAFSSPIKKLGNKAREKTGEYYGTLIPTVIPLFFVWFANGFWHGASWKYVVYGLYYFVLMMVGKFIKPITDKILKKCHINGESKSYFIVSILRTNLIVVVGMLLFRSHSITDAFTMTGRIFTQFGKPILFCENYELRDLIIVAIGFLLLLVVDILKEKKIDILQKLREHSFIFTWVILFALCFSLIIFGKYGAGSGASPFIYGQF